MFISIILILLTALYYALTRKYNYWKDRNIPFKEPEILFGNYRENIFMKKNVAVLVQEMLRDFPDEPMVGAFIATEPVLLIQDPELIKLITTKDYYYFNAREVLEHTHKEVVTSNMFFTYGDRWKVLRQNLTPLFSSAKLKNMFPLVEKCSREFESLLQGEKTQDFEAKSLMVRFTMDCICSCVFGLDSNVMKDNTGDNEFSKLGNAVFESKSIRHFHVILRRVWPTIFYALRLRIFSKPLINFFTKILTVVFQNRNYEPSSRHDFVDLMLDLKKQKYINGDKIKNFKRDNSEGEKITIDVNDGFMIAQCILFFSAGFETSASTSSFLLYELAKNKEIQKKVLEEVDKYISEHERIEFDCVTKLPYLDNCIDEALRLYPIVPVITREVYEPYTMPNGVHLDKGIRVHLPAYHIHRLPQYFKDPDEFQPERFSSENKKNIVPYAYFPFGEGPRICIGMRFAKMQILAALLVLFRSFELDLAEGMPRTLQFDSKVWLPLKSSIGIHLRLIRRDNVQNFMSSN